MSTINSITSIPAGGPYRALVTYANSTTGEIKVKIPALLGTDVDIPVSYIGRFKQITNLWSVPSVNSQIVVSSDDSSLTNVFWMQTDGLSDILQRLTLLEEQVSMLLLRRTA